MKIQVLLWTETDDVVTIEDIHSWCVSSDGILEILKEIDQGTQKTIASFAAGAWVYIKVEND